MRHPRARSTAAIDRALQERMWPGVGGEAERAILSGATNEEALRAVLDRFPKAKTTLKSIASYRARLRKTFDEERIPTDPEIKRIRREAEPNKVVRLSRSA